MLPAESLLIERPEGETVTRELSTLLGGVAVLSDPKNGASASIPRLNVHSKGPEFRERLFPKTLLLGRVAPHGGDKG